MTFAGELAKLWRMRALLIAAVLVLGCGGGEPIAQTVSPVGCWSAPPVRLALRTDGTATRDDVGGSVSGTWQRHDDAIQLDLGGALQLWQIRELTASEMWTDGGTVTHWQSIACE